MAASAGGGKYRGGTSGSVAVCYFRTFLLFFFCFEVFNILKIFFCKNPQKYPIQYGAEFIDSRVSQSSEKIGEFQYYGFTKFLLGNGKKFKRVGDE